MPKLFVKPVMVRIDRSDVELKHTLIIRDKLQLHFEFEQDLRISMGESENCLETKMVLFTLFSCNSIPH